MAISKVKFKDLKEIFVLVNEAIHHMESQEIYQWNDYYPSEDNFYSDVYNESLYKWEDSEIKGIIAFDEIPEVEYSNVNWNFKHDNVLIIHRLVVLPLFQGQGFGKKLMDFAEDFALENGHNAIRLDAYSGNEQAINFYLKRGYRKAGEVMFPKRELPFYCFEKEI